MTRPSSVRCAGSLLLVLAATSCREGTNPVESVPATLAFAVQPSGATAGIAIAPTIRVAVQDASGNTVPSATTTVTLAITAGTGASGATLLGSLTVDAASGIASFSALVIEKAAEGYTLTATAANLTSGTSSAFTISPAAPSKLAITGQPSDVTAGANISPSPQVTIQDAFANTVTTATANVTIAITAGTGATGATLGGTIAVAAAAGVASFANLAVDRAAPGYSLTATATDLAGATTSAFDVLAGTPLNLGFIQQPTNIVAGSDMTPPVQVAVQDEHGNTVTTATSTIEVGITGGTGSAGAAFSGVVSQTASSGVASFPGISVARSGAGYTVTASVAGAELNGAVSTPFDVTVGAAANLAVMVQPEHSFGGSPIDPAVQIAVQDALGNNVERASDAITLAITPGTGIAGAVLGGTVTRTPSPSGVAVFTGLSIDKNASSEYTLTATATGLTDAVTNPFYINVGPAASLAFTSQPSSTSLLAVITPPVVVEALDAGGNTVFGFESTIALTLTAGSGGVGADAVLGGLTSRPAYQGIAAFNDLTLDKAGTAFTLTASAAGLTVVSPPFDVAPGTGLGLQFLVQPTTATAGFVITPAIEVRVRDGNGNTVTDATHEISLAITAGTGTMEEGLLGTWPISTVAGVATFNDISTPFAANGYTLTATAPGIASATSSAFDIAARGPAKLAFTVEPSTTPPDAVISPAVEVTARDEFNNHVPDATDSVTLTLVTCDDLPGPALGGTNPQAAVGGVATFADLTISVVGCYKLMASAPGLTGDLRLFNILP